MSSAYITAIYLIDTIQDVHVRMIPKACITFPRQELSVYLKNSNCPCKVKVHISANSQNKSM